MKEATGELNVTVIVVTIVAVLSLFFFSYLWPMIRRNFEGQTQCDRAICPASPSEEPHDGVVKCYYRDKNGAKHDITCTWKG